MILISFMLNAVFYLCKMYDKTHKGERWIVEIYSPGMVRKTGRWVRVIEFALPFTSMLAAVSAIFKFRTRYPNMPKVRIRECTESDL